MANLDRLAEIIVSKYIIAVKTKIDMIIEGILQGYLNNEGTTCNIEDIINVNSENREI